MKYTRKQLIDAYCEKARCQPSDIPAIITQRQQQIDQHRADMQQMLDEIPTNAEVEIRREAVEYLLEQNKKEVLESNKDVKI